MRITQTLGAAFAAALVTGLTACSDTADTPAAAQTTRSIETTTTTTALDAETLGPTGYLGLDLGASWTEETARNNGKPIGTLNDGKGDTLVGCAFFELQDKSGGWLNDGRVVMLHTGNSPTVRTPEGITTGSTQDQVRAAYPSLQLGANWSSADVPGHPGFHYGFMGIHRDNGYTKGNTVRSLLLFSDQDNCHN